MRARIMAKILLLASVGYLLAPAGAHAATFIATFNRDGWPSSADGIGLFGAKGADLTGEAVTETFVSDPTVGETTVSIQESIN